jgi:transcriptional regulator with XRE-family HTH domain
MNKSQLAKALGVSRTYITLLSQGKRHPGPDIVNKLRQLKVDKLGQLRFDVSELTRVDTVHSFPKLQTRWGALSVSGGFDSHPLPLISSLPV